jgi:hypothetical protein
MLSFLSMILVLFIHGTALSQDNMVSLRVNDLETGTKEALVVPAQELRNTPREFYRYGRSQFGMEVSEFTMLYNLQNKDGRQAGFESIIAGQTVVYDQKPYLILNTNTGHKWTNTAQSEVHEGGLWSSGFYRDFEFRPFRFYEYEDAIGSFKYHVFADRILEETRIAHDANSIGNVSEVYVEYPIAFSSYQVYEGAEMNPVQTTEIASGALIIERPNGSLFGFTFSQTSVNGKVQIVEQGGQLLVRHFASLDHIESIRENTRIFRWGRRIFASADYYASREHILGQMNEELNPLSSSAFQLSVISNNHDFHTQAHEIEQQVQYDPIAGYYRYRITGLSWGGSIKDVPYRYPGLRVTVSSNEQRNFFLMQETSSPDNAVVLQDDHGYALPISVGIGRSLGGEGNPDWTGDWLNRDPFMAQFERFGWGRSLFPVRLQSHQAISFRVLHLVHRWGPNQFIGTGSVVSHVPLFTSTAGVWCVLDLNPWYGSVGDFRSFSSIPTGYAWGEVIPGNEEQYAHGLEFTIASIGDRDRDYQGAQNITHNLSNFKIPLRYDIENGKADLNIVVSALPDTDESRILVDVEFVIKEDIHIAPGERVRFNRIMNPNSVLFYNAFWSSTADDNLQPSYISLDPGLHVPEDHVQTTILEGSKPAFALADKRWMGDPGNANPQGNQTFDNVESNMYLQVFDKEFIINGQPANEQLALRIAKEQPNTNHWHNKLHFYDNEYYLSYDLVLERDNFTLRAGDKISLSYMLMTYGGKASDNEISSAQRTHSQYNLPHVSVTTGSDISNSDYPWIPVVRSADGSTAEFMLQGGLDKLTFSVEGLHSWKPLKLFRLQNGQQEEINYSVNGHDGYKSYVDERGLIGISIPVSMSDGSLETYRVEQDNAGVPLPDSEGSSSSEVSSSSAQSSSSLASSQSNSSNYWDFEGGPQGWTLTQGLTNSFHSSLLRLTVTEGDPQMHSPSSLNLYAGDYPFLQFGLRNRSSDTTAEFFWTRTTGSAFNANKWKSFTVVPNDNAQRTYVVDVGSHSAWIDTITQLRLDPVQNVSEGMVNLDFIKFSAAYPFANQAHAIPGILQVEDFNQGGQGNGYWDVSGENEGGAYRPDEGVDILSISGGGHAIGWVQSGEWLDYLMQADTDFYGDISIRAASVHQGDSIQLFLNGRALGEALVFSAGQGFDDYRDVGTTASIPAGLHVLRVQIVKADGGLNLDYIDFAPIENPVGGAITPNKTIELQGAKNAHGYDLQGRKIQGAPKGLWIDAHGKLRVSL